MIQDTSDERVKVVVGERHFWSDSRWIAESAVFANGAGGNIMCLVCGGYDQHKRGCAAEDVSLNQPRSESAEH